MGGSGTALGRAASKLPKAVTHNVEAGEILPQHQNLEGLFTSPAFQSAMQCGARALLKYKAGTFVGSRGAQRTTTG